MAMSRTIKHFYRFLHLAKGLGGWRVGAVDGSPRGGKLVIEAKLNEYY